MNNVDSQYIGLCNKILYDGEIKHNRTGIDTQSIFCHEMRFNMSDGFPLLTTKKVHFKSVVCELLWFISGDTNIKYLKDNNVRIWDEWANDEGSIGKMYGYQWNKNNALVNLVKNLITNPNSRRHLISCWDTDNLPDENLSPVENVNNGKMALAPCHYSFQFYVTNNRKLKLLVNQRSADIFLGVPFNIASYALLLHMVAKVTGYQADELIWRGGDCHIYENHINQVSMQINRYNKGMVYDLPTLYLNDSIHNIKDFTLNDIDIIAYKHAGVIKGKVAV